MNLKAYYLNLSTSAWKDQPNFNAWLSEKLQLFQDILECALTMPSAFDISIASGVQLDVLGVILGQPRQVGFQPSLGVSPILDDATYRLLLQARIQQNHWNGQLDALIAVWQSLFSGGTLVVDDRQNMSVAIHVAGAFTSIILDLLLNGYVLPRPQGVRYDYTVAALPILGFDRNDVYVAGFDMGYFS